MVASKLARKPPDAGDEIPGVTPSLPPSLSLSLSRLTIDTDCVTLTVAVLVSYHTCDLDVCASAPLPDRGSSGGVYYITK